MECEKNEKLLGAAPILFSFLLPECDAWTYMFVRKYYNNVFMLQFIYI